VFDLGKSLSLSGPHLPHLQNERVVGMLLGAFHLLPSVLLGFGSFQDLPRDEHVSDPDPYVLMACDHRRVTGDLLLWVGRLRHSPFWSWVEGA